MPPRDAGRPTRSPTLAPDDPVAVVWTSGTTGLPKGAVFDHRGLAAVAAGTDVLSQPGDRRLSPLPFAHVGSMTRVWDEMANGVTTVITPTPWRAGDAIARHGRRADHRGPGGAHPVGAGAGPSRPRPGPTCPLPPHRRHGGVPGAAGAGGGPARRLGVPVVVRYTSTEASLGTGTVPGDPDEVVATTVGRPVPGVELSVVDDDRPGRCRRGGRAGPAAVGGGDARLLGRTADRAGRRGRGLRQGRHPSRARRRRVAHHGRFGSAGRDGCLHLVGRVGRAATSAGGYNVYPAEVEAVLSAHAGRRPGGGGRGPRPGARRDRCRLRGPVEDRRRPPGGTRRSCSVTARHGGLACWPTTRRPTGWWWSTGSRSRR